MHAAILRGSREVDEVESPLVEEAFEKSTLSIDVSNKEKNVKGA